MAPDIAGSYTASKTWRSIHAKERDAFARFRDNCAHVAPRSPFTPATWPEWLKHRLWAKEEAHRKAVFRLEAKRRALSSSRASLPAFSGRPFGDCRSSVLAMESIWVPELILPPGRPQAPWPTNDELKYEGPYRHVSGFCRFHPLPRVPGNTTAHWRQRPPLAPFAFDRVGSPLRRAELPVGKDNRMCFLIGKELLEEIDL